MARRRDYSAEYRQRQERSLGQYGVGYGARRGIERKAADKGIPAGDVRDTLSKIRAKGGDPRDVSRALDAHMTRAREGGRGRDEWPEDYQDFDIDIPEWWLYDRS